MIFIIQLLEKCIRLFFEYHEALCIRPCDDRMDAVYRMEWFPRDKVTAQ